MHRAHLDASVKGQPKQLSSITRRQSVMHHPRSHTYMPILWGDWDLNPGPTDYESLASVSATSADG